MELESSLHGTTLGPAAPVGLATPVGLAAARGLATDKDLATDRGRAVAFGPATSRASRSALQMPIAPEPEIRASVPATATRLVLGSCLFSIRVPPQSAIVNCELCAKPFSAQGPTGYYDDRPICDACLLEQENQLGMLMALAIFTRSYARLAATEGEAAAEAAVEMLAFARIYELFAARFCPARPFDFSSVSALGDIG